jgi:hypothetical protein
MITSIKIERYKDYEELMRIVSHSDAAPATDKDLLRPLHYHMLIGTHLPDEYQVQAGALAALLFGDPVVSDIEIWRIGKGDWIADALIETARGHRLRRGEGKTPVEALNNLVVDAQRS